MTIAQLERKINTLQRQLDKLSFEREEDAEILFKEIEKLKFQVEMAKGREHDKLQ